MSLGFLGERYPVLGRSTAREEAEVAVHMGLIAITEGGCQIHQTALRRTVNGHDCRLHTEYPQQELRRQSDGGHDGALPLTKAEAAHACEGLYASDAMILLQLLNRLVEGCQLHITSIKSL